MSEIVKYKDSSIVKYLNDNDGKMDLPVPFEREIFLFYTFIAGVTFVEGFKEIEPLLKLDEKLDFFREPDNSHDKRAIVIKTASGVKVGYVPRKDNIIFSRLMDAGKLLYGTIKSKETISNWVKITIRVFLKE